VIAVHNRPGYFRALAWALFFFWHGTQGRVEIRHKRGMLLWECWPASESWVSTNRLDFHLVWLALRGRRFQMDATDYVIQLELRSANDPFPFQSA
jgi:hypothetical protein